MKRFLLILITLLIIASPASANFFPDITVTSTDGIWTDTRAFATINAAATAIGAVDKRTIVIPNAQVVTALTITSNITLKFERDGSIANSGQLTIQTPNIIADDHQIFTGAGDIDFASGSVVRSTWFSDIDEALDVTNDDTLTMIIAQTETTTANMAVGDDVTLRWESPFIITVDAGDVLSNVKNIEAGNYQILAGAGDVDFLDGTDLKLDWFLNLRAILTWAATEEVTLNLSSPHTVDFTDTVTDNISIISSKGNILTISTGIVLTIEGDFIAGTYKAFTYVGTGNVLFSTARRINSAWFATYQTELGESLNDAIDSIAAVGGEIYIPPERLTLTTGVDATGLARAINFVGGFRNLNFPTIYAATSGVPVFDLTRSNTIGFYNIGIEGHVTNPPNVAFLMARDNGGGAAGDHVIQDCMIRGYYTNSVLYMYGSELNRITNNTFANRTDGQAVIQITSGNVDGLVSANQTIAAGVQSNTEIRLIGNKLFANGTAGTTDCIRIDGGANITIRDGFFWTNAGGRSEIYVSADSAQETANVVVDGNRFESGTGPTYNIYWNTGAKAQNKWTVTNNSMAAATNTMFAANGTSVSALTVFGNHDSNARGASFDILLNSVYISDSALTVRTLLRASIVMGPPPTTTGDLRNIILDTHIGAIKAPEYGVYHDRGNKTLTPDFAVGTFVTNGARQNLDLSAIVPAGARSVVLSVIVQDDAVSSLIRFVPDGQADFYNSAGISTQVINVSNYGDLVVSCGDNRIVDYIATSLAWTTIDVTVKGWTF